MLQIIILAVILMGIAFAGFAIKILIQKDGEFKKSCSSVHPTTGERLGCVCGHGDGSEECENKDEVKVAAIKVESARL